MATRCRNTGQLVSKAAFGRLETRPGVMCYKRNNFIGVSLFSTPERTVECVQSGGDQLGLYPTSWSHAAAATGTPIVR